MTFKPMMSAEAVSAFWDAHFPQIQAGGYYRIIEIGPGQAALRLEPTEQHLRPGATISGPTLFTLADVTAYAALIAHIGPEPLIVTVNQSINFMRRAPLGPLIGRCTILKLGKRLAVVETGIRPEAGGDLIAYATGTYSIPPHSGSIIPPT
jgi:uncharacterized protein (TIGR00369 family)